MSAYFSERKLCLTQKSRDFTAYIRQFAPNTAEIVLGCWLPAARMLQLAHVETRRGDIEETLWFFVNLSDPRVYFGVPQCYFLFQISPEP
jgi:hypothetical protein